MSKLFTAGFVALFAAVSIAATTVPAAAGNHHHNKHHKHHGHHGHHGYWNHDFYFDFGSIGYDEPDPIYCVGKHGKLYICGWN